MVCLLSFHLTNRIPAWAYIIRTVVCLPEFLSDQSSACLSFHHPVVCLTEFPSDQSSACLSFNQANRMPPGFPSSSRLPAGVPIRPIVCLHEFPSDQLFQFQFFCWISRGNYTTLSAMELICTSEIFKKYQNLTNPQGELNLNFLKKSRV